MKIGLPKYTSKDYLVLAIIILPFTVVMNSVILGAKYYSDWLLFTQATIITGIAFCIDFVFCGGVAVLLKKRFPEEKDVALRMALMICMFLLITGLFLLLLFRGYEMIHFWGYTFNEKGFVWSYIAMGIVNIFLTFLHEGIARYEKWRENLKETEALRLAHRQSQLEGLKSQVNPHFLFNSLNSLSSLIAEDEVKAEKFLNEMSKVYRYMLRNEEDKLVSLETELGFLQSYLYLLKTRFGEGLHVDIMVNEEDRKKLLPPLALQLIVENAFTQNIINKNSPLIISIKSCPDYTEYIVVCNNLQPKTVVDAEDTEMALDNLVKKYQLLNQLQVIIEDKQDNRCIKLPLLTREEEVII